MGEVKISYHPSCDKVPHPGPYSSQFHETFISDAHIVCNDISSVEKKKKHTRHCPDSESHIVKAFWFSNMQRDFSPFQKAFLLCLITYTYKFERLGRALRVSGSIPIRRDDRLYQLSCAFHFWAVRLTTTFGKLNKNTQQRRYFMLTQAWGEWKQFLN